MRSRFLTPSLALLFIALLATKLIAADSGGAGSEPTPVEPTQVEGLERALSPLTQELFDCAAAEQEQLAELNLRYQNAATEVEALAIQNEIAALKRGTELQLLQIQLRHAREGGRLAQVTEIEQALRLIEAGDRTGEPRPRAAVVND